MALTRRSLLLAGAAAAIGGCGADAPHHRRRQRDSPVRAVMVGDGEVVCVDFARDGRTLYAGDASGTVSLIDAGELRVARRIRGGGRVWGVAAQRDGSVAWCADDQPTRILDPGASRPRRLGGGFSGVAVAWRPPGRAPLAVGRSDGVVALLGTGRRLQGLATPALGVAWDPDGRRVAACEYAGEARIWDVRTGRARRIRYADDDFGADMNGALWLDRNRLAVACQDGVVRIWRGEGGEPFARLEGGDGWARALAMSPSQHVLADAGQDGRVRFTDRGASELGAGTAGGSSVWGLAFSPDGRTLAAACGDGAVRLFPAPRAAWAATS